MLVRCKLWGVRCEVWAEWRSSQVWSLYTNWSWLGSNLRDAPLLSSPPVTEPTSSGQFLSWIGISDISTSRGVNELHRKHKNYKVTVDRQFQIQLSVRKIWLNTTKIMKKKKLMSKSNIWDDQCQCRGGKENFKFKKTWKKTFGCTAR